MKSMGCTPTGRHSVIFVDACFIVLLFPSPKFLNAKTTFSISSNPSSFLSTCNFYLQYTLPNNLISCKNKMQFMLKKNTINVLLKVVSIDRKIFFVHVTQDNNNVFTPCSYCVARVCKWPLAVII